MVSFELLREERLPKLFFPSLRYLFSATLYNQTFISFLGLSFVLLRFSLKMQTFLGEKYRTEYLVDLNYTIICPVSSRSRKPGRKQAISTGMRETQRMEARHPTRYFTVSPLSPEQNLVHLPEIPSMEDIILQYPFSSSFQVTDTPPPQMLVVVTETDRTFQSLLYLCVAI